MIASLLLWFCAWVYLLAVVALVARRSGRADGTAVGVAALAGVLLGGAHYAVAARESVMTLAGEVTEPTPWALISLGAAACTALWYALLPARPPGGDKRTE